MYRTAEDLRVRPSQLLDLQYAWVALDVDAAVYTFGKHVEAAMRDAQLARADIERSRKKSANREQLQAASQEVFNELVLGVIRRERRLHSFAHRRPFLLVEELRKVDGEDKWVEVSRKWLEGRSTSVMGQVTK